MHTEANPRLKLVNQLRRALPEQQLVRYFQPVVDVVSGKITKALLRWQHPHRGLIFPDEFIGPAEETGMISEIGNGGVHASGNLRQVLQRVAWRAVPDQHQQVAGAVPAECHANGLARYSISVEITEGGCCCNPMRQPINCTHCKPEALTWPSTILAPAFIHELSEKAGYRLSENWSVIRA